MSVWVGWFEDCLARGVVCQDRRSKNAGAKSDAGWSRNDAKKVERVR